MNNFFKFLAVKDLDFSVYNHWGKLVYSFISPNNAWDEHNTSGEPYTSRVYFYFLSAKSTDGKEYSEKGSLQLLQ